MSLCKEEILTSGTNGGFAIFVSSLSHSIPLNQGCRLISSSPLGPHPKRFDISRSQNYIILARIVILDKL